MSAEKLNEIKERAEKATSGPWTVDSYGEISSDYNADDVVYVDNEGWLAGKRQDLEFIAHAREDIPALVVEVERLRDVLESAGGMFSIGEGGKAMDYICKGLGDDWTYFDEGDLDD